MVTRTTTQATTDARAENAPAQADNAQADAPVSALEQALAAIAALEKSKQDALNGLKDMLAPMRERLDALAQERADALKRAEELAAEIDQTIARHDEIARLCGADTIAQPVVQAPAPVQAPARTLRTSRENPEPAVRWARALRAAYRCLPNGNVHAPILHLITLAESLSGNDNAVVFPLHGSGQSDNRRALEDQARGILPTEIATIVKARIGTFTLAAPEAPDVQPVAVTMTARSCDLCKSREGLYDAIVSLSHRVVTSK